MRASITGATAGAGAIAPGSGNRAGWRAQVAVAAEGDCVVILILYSRSKPGTGAVPSPATKHGKRTVSQKGLERFHPLDSEPNVSLEYLQKLIKLLI